MKSWWRIVGVVVAVQLVFGGLYLLFRPEESQAPAERPGLVQRKWEEELDAPAPDIAFERPDGTSGRLSELADGPVLVHFWATWCPPCVEELPRLMRVAADEGFTLLAVAVDDDVETLRAFFDGNVPAEVVLPEDDAAGRYEVGELPQTIVVDEQRQMRLRMAGARPWQQDDLASVREALRP